MNKSKRRDQLYGRAGVPRKVKREPKMLGGGNPYGSFKEETVLLLPFLKSIGRLKFHNPEREKERVAVGREPS